MLSDDCLSSNNAVYLEEIYQSYLKDRNSVDPSWCDYFANHATDNSGVYRDKNQIKSETKNLEYNLELNENKQQNISFLKLQQQKEEKLSAIAAQIVQFYRSRGHLQVKLDPLGLENNSNIGNIVDLKTFGITEKEAKNQVWVDQVFALQRTPLNILIEFLRKTYASRIGFEFEHLESEAELKWWRHKVEINVGVPEPKAEVRLKALEEITKAELFERYLHNKFVGMKRFSIEGLESVIVAVNTIIGEVADRKCQKVVIGMAHRGRLNTLVQIMHKPLHMVIYECMGNSLFPTNANVPGDVKYHMGWESRVSTNSYTNEDCIDLDLAPNPSHLESVNGVVIGRVKAFQDEGIEAIGLLLHGDAALAGQGVVMETLGMAGLNGYSTNGTIHIAMNNQVGFTANPNEGRSTRYCTDIAKFIDVPVLHINAADVDAIIYAAQLATEYRYQFGKDVFIDIVGYRRYGHNEGDEPFFTQPKMYQVINGNDFNSIMQRYAATLIKERITTTEEQEEKITQYNNFLAAEYELATKYTSVEKLEDTPFVSEKWKKYLSARQIDQSHLLDKNNPISNPKPLSFDQTTSTNPTTGIDLDLLKKLGTKLIETPKKFNLNPKIARQFATKAEMIEGKIPCDWSMGEGLAFASLLYDGSGIRLSGEDAKRGTFSHRHAILVDQKTEEEYTPFANLKPNQGHFQAYSSHLSEYGVLAFEYGYSTVNPNSLTIWEAQFGDFANGAQIVIDQYIASAEAKWLQMSALTILLPHGNEGQGPEHTSARLERYLQLYSDSNMLICNCTTPASLFHVLRRQIYAKFRKPLVLMTPKSLLRHKLAVSDLAEMGTGTAFQPLIATTVVGDKVVPLGLDITTNNHKANKPQPTSQIKNQIKRIIFCSGKIYYDLLQKIQDDKIEKYLLVRLEQLAPFPVTEVSALLSYYNDAAVIWCQEEHKNMGGYSFVLPYFMLFGTFPRYAGRAESASPSTGFAKVHAAEHAKVLSDALL